jgi:hypothetical protein
MRKGNRFLSAAAGAASILVAGLAVSPAAAAPLFVPQLFPGQQDGVFVTNNATFVEFVQLNESKEAFFSVTSFRKPRGFKEATIYLTENGATSCTPDPTALSLGNCSDGLTVETNPLNGHLDISFVSDGATATELALFFDGFAGLLRGVSTNVSFLAETGLWQDVSSVFGQNAGFAFVQSSIDTPEPVTLSLFGVGLCGVVAIRRRRSNRTV